MTIHSKTTAALLGLLLFSSVAVVLAQQQKNKQATVPERFDNLVREDFFSGMSGDTEAFNRAMKLCEAQLATNSHDPEAMVWHGAGLYVLAGKAFRAGQRDDGIRLRNQAMEQMDAAVKLLPTVQTLVPRGAVLLTASRYIANPEIRQPVLKQGLADFEKTLQLDGVNFPKRCRHARGELLGGLAEGWYRLGDQEKADLYLKRILAELPGTEYSAAARSMLDNKPSPEQASTTCLGCHTTGAQ